MPIIPLRTLGSLGVITDVDPYDLPPNAFSFAKNVRCEAGRIERGGVFRTFGTPRSTPKVLYGYRHGSGAERLVVCDEDGAAYEWSPTGLTTLGPTTFTAGFPSGTVTTLKSVNNTLFLNRPDAIPLYKSKDGVLQFQPLPTTAGQWPSDWRAEVLTEVAGVVVALGITQAGIQKPNAVFWSNFVPYGGTPDWDYVSPTSSSGLTTLAGLRDPLLEGLSLKNRLMLYTRSETWFMEYIGGNDMFRFDRQFDKGLINNGAVIETGGIHYCFGTDDLWAHDGMTSKSLSQDKVRRFVFSTLRKSEQPSFFVTHNPDQNEVMFCYVSDDRYCAFPSNLVSGCNRAAIYNTASDLWYFADLPYVTCATRAATAFGRTFDSSTTAIDSLGGSFSSQEGGRRLSLVFGGRAAPSLQLGNSLRTFASPDSSETAYPIDIAASPGALMIREGMDLDEVGAHLTGYKLVRSIYPQIRQDPNSIPMTFTCGSHDHPNESPVWQGSQTFSNSFNKLDFNTAGRFLDLKIEQGADTRMFTLSGLDFDLGLLGVR